MNETNRANKKTTVTLDLRGEVCPWPATYSLLKLKRMTAGEILEVLADGLCAVEGIPSAMAQAGHKVLSVETVGDGVYCFMIQVG